MDSKNQTKELKPSDFCVFPSSSIMRNMQHEIVAWCIMEFLKRTGDAWREMTWEEFRKERSKEMNYEEWHWTNEKRLFDRVLPHTISAENAIEFSPAWKKQSLS